MRRAGVHGPNYMLVRFALGQPRRLSGTPPVLASMASHGFAVGQDILVMFFHGAGEAVMALRVRHEIVEIGFCWMHRGFQGTAAGIRDRAGRKSGVAIGIVWGLESHIGVMQSALVRARQ